MADCHAEHSLSINQSSKMRREGNARLLMSGVFAVTYLLHWIYVVIS